jgi:hypothetical protein
MDAFTAWAVEQNCVFIDADQFPAIPTKGRGQTDSLLTVNWIHSDAPFTVCFITAFTFEIRKGSHFIASSFEIFSAGQKIEKAEPEDPAFL